LKAASWKAIGSFLIFFCCSNVTRGQAPAPTSIPAPSCVVPAGLRAELHSRLNYSQFNGVKSDEENSRRIAILKELIAKYPREIEMQKELIELSLWTEPRALPATQDFFHNQEQQNPSDPLALYAAGYSFSTTDTQTAIRKLNKAIAIAPEYPWPYLALALLYSEGKTADAKAMQESAERFFSLCPNVPDRMAKWLLTKVGTEVLKKKIAPGLRQYLEAQTEPELLRGYETLWALEFQTRPPQEFDALRQKLGEDLIRIEGLNPKPDAEFQAFLIQGHKQSGAPPATIEAKENRLLQEYAKSSQAYGIAYSRWVKSHKEPEDQKDVMAWANYNREWKEARKKWIHEFTDDYYLTHYAWTNQISDDDALSPEEVLQVFENKVKQAEEGYQSVWDYTGAADFLLEHRIQPERVLEVLNEAERVLARDRESARMDTNRTADQTAKFDERTWSEWWRIVSSTLEAARQLKRPELVARMRAEVEGPLPEKKKYASWYWMNRARLARLEDRNADALAYYQLARQTDLNPPDWWRGKLHDRFSDEVKPFWKELGGTEAAWNTWTTPLTKGKELTKGRWEKAVTPLANFDLIDVSGKNWRLKDLNGKVLLINLWATWCGPCQAELPHVQKLFEITKSRKDIQVLTFNLDESPGLIQSFLKEHGYQFPVMLAFNSFSAQLEEGIPQNWIVDSNGNWQWTQLGMGTADQWEEMILAKLEEAKTPE
jgi:thiol-disulfide isomerase/thioredoxin